MPQTPRMGSPGDSPGRPKKGPKKTGTLRGDMQALLDIMWEALLKVKVILDEQTDTEWTLKAAHAVSQLGGQYGKLLELSDYDQRLAALEQAMLLREVRQAYAPAPAQAPPVTFKRDDAPDARKASAHHIAGNATAWLFSGMSEEDKH